MAQMTEDPRVRASRELFERAVKPRLHSSDATKMLAIDLTSGDYECHEDDYTAVSRLRSRHPEGEIWLMRADGSPASRMRVQR